MKRSRQVRAVMTADVATVEPGMSAEAAVAVLERREVSGAPVVGEDGRVLGFVTRGDLSRRRSGRCFGRRHKTGKVGEAMSTPPVTVGVDDDVVRAVRLMDAGRVRRLPVLGADGALAGIVSYGDLGRVFLRPDSEIRDEVRDEVLDRELCLDPASLDIAVRDGVVSLTGTVERDSMVPVIPVMLALVGRVDGVVAVQEHLRVGVDARIVLADEPAAGRVLG
ncbi:CBS domain-containing protein [Amycolatopsis dendrobii]|uniref:CBS domain-containing protein n=1 Tax=Amycolatopsis dendrobii TaxID=2760662 RepID=A0A7W3VWE2_9PSEU|nr:CBS domain-containing protein [Amycolatopsis dendrobii]MBB1154493.1 CBS domain-containing protein [Amycolatopsis dendrobii]